MADYFYYFLSISAITNKFETYATDQRTHIYNPADGESNVAPVTSVAELHRLTVTVLPNRTRRKVCDGGDTGDRNEARVDKGGRRAGFKNASLVTTVGLLELVACDWWGTSKLKVPSMVPVDRSKTKFT